jgi:hypothetical protein
MSSVAMTRAALIVCAGVAGTSGCGGSDDPPSEKERYESEVTAVLERTKTQPPIQSGAAEGPEREIELARELRRRVVALTDELGRIDPPDEIAEAHRTLVDGTRTYGEGEALELIEALERGDTQETVVGPEPEDRATVTAIREARAELVAKGYDIDQFTQVAP